MKALLILIGLIGFVALTSCGPSRDELRMEGCTKSANAILTEIYGPIQMQLNKDKIDAVVESNCKRILEIK